MLEYTQGDSVFPMRAVIRQDGAALDISGDTLTGELIYQDGTRVAIVPTFDADAAGDGTDGALSYSGSAQASVPVGLHHYQFFASPLLGRRSSKKIPFRVLPNA